MQRLAYYCSRRCLKCAGNITLFCNPRSLQIMLFRSGKTHIFLCRTFFFSFFIGSTVRHKCSLPAVRSLTSDPSVPAFMQTLVLVSRRRQMRSSVSIKSTVALSLKSITFPAISAFKCAVLSFRSHNVTTFSSLTTCSSFSRVF